MARVGTFFIAVLYNLGRGVNRDPKRAFELYKLAADLRGTILHNSILENNYAAGDDVIQSDTLAFTYYKLSDDSDANLSIPFHLHPSDFCCCFCW